MKNCIVGMYLPCHIFRIQMISLSHTFRGRQRLSAQTNKHHIQKRKGFLCVFTYSQGINYVSINYLLNWFYGKSHTYKSSPSLSSQLYPPTYALKNIRVYYIYHKPWIAYMLIIPPLSSLGIEKQQGCYMHSGR